jgi:hypothetical protein
VQPPLRPAALPGRSAAGTGEGEAGLAAYWRILLPSAGGEAPLPKIAAYCDDLGMTTRRFPPPWRADKMPGG